MANTKLTKKQKVLNLLSKGKAVAWTTMRNKFDLTSPRAGASKIFKKSMNDIVAAGIKSLYGKQKYAYSNQ